MQRYLFKTIRTHGKPITFADLRRIILEADNAPPGVVLREPVERSLRRALHSMVRDKILLALGSGGRGDPYHYFPNPLIAAVAGDKEEFEALMATLKAERRKG